MRWKSLDAPVLHGERRVWTGFLWLPTLINGENRWLERASILREANTLDNFDGGVDWSNLEWVDGAHAATKDQQAA